MDTYGIILFIIGIGGYFILRKRAPGWATVFVWVWGAGTGIFVASIWAVLIVNRILGG